MKHNLYKDGDKNIPEVIKDTNGEVVLALCKRCGLAEGDLLTQPECKSKVKVFLSARYSRRDELKKIRTILQSKGYEVCSRWLDTDWNETERDAIYSSAAPSERIQEYAQIDVEDVKACDVFVSFTEEPRSSSRGGRHVETGIAIGMNKYLIVIGPRENIFHNLPQIMHVYSSDPITMVLHLIQYLDMVS